VVLSLRVGGGCRRADERRGRLRIGQPAIVPVVAAHRTTPIGVIRRRGCRALRGNRRTRWSIASARVLRSHVSSRFLANFTSGPTRRTTAWPEPADDSDGTKSVRARFSSRSRRARGVPRFRARFDQGGAGTLDHGSNLNSWSLFHVARGYPTHIRAMRSHGPPRWGAVNALA